jgi:hypothetical protein
MPTERRFPALKLLVPLAVLTLLLLAVFRTPQPPAPVGKDSQSSASAMEVDPSRILVRPFKAEGERVALALDGGELPILGSEVPGIIVGRNILRTVHLAWLHDWTDAECRTSFKNLQALYASEEGPSLPALKIHLNPVFSLPLGEAVHRAMLQVLARGEGHETYLTLAQEISDGSLAADPEAIRKRVEMIAPDLMADWDTRLDWLENDIEQTFAIARVQQARNAAVTGHHHSAQLTSMLAVLPPLADRQGILAFLQDANARQRLWLQALPPPVPGAPLVRCTCTDPSHIHSSPIASKLQMRTVISPVIATDPTRAKADSP